MGYEQGRDDGSRRSENTQQGSTGQREKTSVEWEMGQVRRGALPSLASLGGTWSKAAALSASLTSVQVPLPPSLGIR